MTSTKQLHARAQQIIAEHDVDTVEVAFADTQGHLRGKRIPATFFLERTGEKGFAQADASFYWSWHCELPELPHYNPASDIVDMIVVPDLATLRPTPWRERTALCMADCVSEHGHEPIDADPRHQLRRQVERCQAARLRAGAGDRARVLPDRRGRQAGLRRHPVLLAAEGRRARARRRAHPPRRRGLRHRRRGLEHRVRPGAGRDQLRPRRCDRRPATTPSSSSRSCARSRATTACARRSWPSRSPASPATACTCTTACARTASTSSSTAPTTTPLGNASMRHWVAGLTTHAAQIALLANPTVNAYKRIEDYSFAPTRVSWGLDNRNVAVRCIPQVGPGLARRVPRRRRRRQPLPARGRRAGRRHGRDRARARAAAGGRARRLRRRAPARSCRARWAPRSRPGRRRRSRARRSASASPTTTRASPATTWRSTRPSSPTGKRSATGSSHSLGATRTN